ncbi:MAG: xanthine dehydrogenase molybdopterin binding subunit [Alphaproteobacteria bacterium]|nr:xanthine dehydrogenase molybdopterin binding subunit [Alphaproteobacteria bacterium]
MAGKAQKEISGGMGQPQAHDSAKLHVSGEAVYTDDIREPAGCLHACILKSPHAHAKIKSIDVSACAIPGVHAVMTAKDIPGANEVAPVFAGDPVFATDEVFYAGQSVLAVAAESIGIARKAAHLAKIEYEELPAILNVHDAMRSEKYVGDPYVMQQGDSAAGLSGAQHKISGALDIGGQDHFYLEGQIAMATPQENGEMHCWSSTQHPSEVQHLIAKVLGIRDHLVTVDVRRMGGGFGGKESQASLIACVAALLANKTGRPVKLRLDRDDDMIMTGKRHDFNIRYDVGFDDTGLIAGIEFTQASNCGMSADLSNAIADRAMFHADNCYFLENAKVTSYRCFTHKVSNTAFRGFGGPQGMLAMEYVIDDIARKLGKDPLEVRKVNLYDAKGALKNRCTTHYGMTVEDNIIRDIFAEIEKTGDYAARVKQARDFNAKSPVLKKGIALTPVKFGISFTLTMLNQAGALVHVYKDGTVQLNHGGTEMGQGLHTKVCQVVADEFQIDISDVRITATSTGKVPNTSATAASSGSDLNGMAAQAAARTIKQRLVSFAAQHFNCAEIAVSFHGGMVTAGEETMSFAQMVSLAYVNRVSLSSTGFYSTPKIDWDRPKAKGRPFFYFAYGAAISEVIVDTLTGEYNILRTDILHDAGRALNPAIDIGQVEGGFVQGTGWLTSEELWWNEKGELKTHAPSTYKIPTGRDIPKDFRVALFENENSEQTIYRSKAVGEPPLMLGISVFLALRDAVAACGPEGCLPPLQAPATPENVLKAVQAVRKS